MSSRGNWRAVAIVRFATTGSGLLLGAAFALVAGARRAHESQKAAGMTKRVRSIEAKRPEVSVRTRPEKIASMATGRLKETGWMTGRQGEWAAGIPRPCPRSCDLLDCPHLGLAGGVRAWRTCLRDRRFVLDGDVGALLAAVAELADALGSGPSGRIARGGSSPLGRNHGDYSAAPRRLDSRLSPR